MSAKATRATFGLLAAAAALSACGAASAPQVVPGASANRGRKLIEYYGCGACHKIAGIGQANGHVGPPLTNFRANARFIAGSLPNTPGNVARWIENPQAIRPGTIMPNLGVNARQARDITAYLYGQ